MGFLDMPMIRNRYPKNWEEIALQVKTEAGWKCEQCGRSCRKPGEDMTDFIKRISPMPDLMSEIIAKPRRFTLTVAHLDHTPENNVRSNLKALCTACHCRYDLKDMARKKYLKREYYGQLTLF